MSYQTLQIVVVMLTYFLSVPVASAQLSSDHNDELLDAITRGCSPQ